MYYYREIGVKVKNQNSVESVDDGEIIVRKKISNIIKIEGLNKWEIQLAFKNISTTALTFIERKSIEIDVKEILNNKFN